MASEPRRSNVTGFAASDQVRAALGGGGEVCWTAPRSLLQMVQLLPETEDEVAAVCAAVSLLQWHHENKFSGVDGSPTARPKWPLLAGP